MEEIIYGVWPKTDIYSPLKILASGGTICDEKYFFSRKNSDIYALEYIISGKGTLIVDEKIYSPRTGDIILLRKNQEHKYFSQKNDGWKKIWIMLDGDQAELFFEKYIPRNIDIVQYTDAYPFFVSIKEAIEKFSKDSDLLIKEIAQILFALFSNMRLKISKKEIKNYELIKQYLDMNIFHLSPLTELQQQLHYSKNHIINIFKTAYGITPHQYYMDKKLQLAKQYLLLTQFSNTEIAEKLAFSDQHYFTNCFKNKFGITPSAYRKMKS